MYSKLPNIVLGFHGCDQTTFEKVVCNGEALRPSANSYDWLGSGIYFWEQNYDRGLSWAREQAKRGAIDRPAVIGAVIDLGCCLNLTDSHYIDLVENEYRLMKEDFDLLGLELPKNEGATQDRLLRKLDCAVIEHLHAHIERNARTAKPRLPPSIPFGACFPKALPFTKDPASARRPMCKFAFGIQTASRAISILAVP